MKLTPGYCINWERIGDKSLCGPGILPLLCQVRQVNKSYQKCFFSGAFLPKLGLYRN